MSGAKPFSGVCGLVAAYVGIALVLSLGIAGVWIGQRMRATERWCYRPVDEGQPKTLLVDPQSGGWRAAQVGRALVRQADFDLAFVLSPDGPGYRLTGAPERIEDRAVLGTVMPGACEDGER